jgi:hypothetical protein
MTVYIFPPVTVTVPAPVGGATEAKQDDIIAAVDGVESKLDTLNSKDFATQTTLALVKAATDRIPGDFLSGVSYDATVQTVNATSNVWAFKTGGVSGTTVKTLTINYVDSTKQVIASVVAS